jgi:integrase
MPTEAAPRLVLYRGVWCVYYQRRRYTTHALTRAGAEQGLADFIAGLSRPQAAPGDTVAQVLTNYLANRRERAKPGAERLSWAHKPLTRLIGSRHAGALTEPDFVAYAAARQADGVAPSTTRTELQALRAALRWHLGDRAPKVAMPDRPDARDRWLTRAEAERLLAACERRHLRLFVLLGLHTAARAGAILALTWDRVDLERRRIDYREPGRTATRKRRVPVPINDVLLPELVAAKARAETAHVIEWAGGSVGRVNHGLRDTAARAGVPGVTPHVLRHTAATWMAQAGVPLWQVAGFLGHSDARMVADTYAHHSPEHLEEGARALAGKTQ